jgi:hypothetical protein
MSIAIWGTSVKRWGSVGIATFETQILPLGSPGSVITWTVCRLVVTYRIEPKGSKIHGRRNCFQVPPNKESFVRGEVLSKIVDRSF